jgi:hypothetical protein
MDGDSVKEVSESDTQRIVKQSFLCQQIFPFIDTYAVVLAFFASPAILGQPQEEEVLY